MAGKWTTDFDFNHIVLESIRGIHSYLFYIEYDMILLILSIKGYRLDYNQNLSSNIFLVHTLSRL